MRQIKLLLPLLALLLLPNLSRAESVSVIDSLKSLPLKEGAMVDFKNHRILNTLGLGLINYENFGLDLSYIGVDGLGVTLEYNLGALPVQNIPIIKYVSYLNIGYTVGYRTMAWADLNDNPKSDNQFIQGPTLFCKINF